MITETIRYIQFIILYIQVGDVMKPTRSYRRHGTADFPMSAYWVWATSGIGKKSVYHPETKIEMVISGSITMEIEGVRQLFSQGDIYIIPPNTVYRRISYSKDVNLRNVVFLPAAIAPTPEHFFYREFVEPLMEQRLIFPPLLQPGHPAYDTVREQILSLDDCKIYTSNYKAKRYALLIHICTALLPYCQVIDSVKPVPNVPNETVRNCMRFIHNHYYQKITLQRIANICHLNSHYLCDLFKSYMGQTIFEYLARYRIEAAAELLKKEDLPVSRVAEMVGFCSESLFYQKFKAFTGTTPLTYRKQNIHRED